MIDTASHLDGVRAGRGKQAAGACACESAHFAARTSCTSSTVAYAGVLPAIAASSGAAAHALRSALRWQACRLGRPLLPPCKVRSDRLGPVASSLQRLPGVGVDSGAPVNMKQWRQWCIRQRWSHHTGASAQRSSPSRSVRAHLLPAGAQGCASRLLACEVVSAPWCEIMWELNSYALELHGAKHHHTTKPSSRKAA